MILGKRAILQAMDLGLLAVAPWDGSQLQAAHIDLHLSADTAELIIPSKTFVLARTQERITISDSLCGFMEGRAGLAKRGLSVEQSSTFIEPGSDSQMTLELFNATDEPIVLHANDPIAKLFIGQIMQELQADG